MKSIDDYIIQSKNKKNISSGGSSCFDFGDLVLVEYILPLRFVKNGEHARDSEEIVFVGVNKKRDEGVNVPRHIAFKRVIEDDNEICYVLQEKAKGNNCSEYNKYGVSFKEMIDKMYEIYDIPFNQVLKLIKDGCSLYEMGYEAQGRNLFYDEYTGFWYIDFLKYDLDDVFDYDDIIKVFKAIKYRIPSLIDLIPYMRYNTKLTDEQLIIKNRISNLIKTKNLLAIKSVIPVFNKYEKFYLVDENDIYKEYLIKNNVVKYDLFSLDEKDYLIFNELYELVINNIIEKILKKEVLFWQVECNEIRINSNLFNLRYIWKYHKGNKIIKEEYDEEYDYELAVCDDFDKRMMNDIINRLLVMEKNDVIEEFLSDANKWETRNKRYDYVLRG